jgi:RNA polymerase sporulation-specific sigma factor
MDMDAWESFRELDRIAIEAKTDEGVFKELMERLMPLLYGVSHRYQIPYETNDEILQILRIELWNAVRAYQPEKHHFFQFARMFIENRMKTVMRRRVYSRKHCFLNQMKRLEEGIGNQDDRSYANVVPVVEEDLIKEMVGRLAKERLYDLLDEILTDLEKECFIRRFLFDQPHAIIYKEMHLMSLKSVDNAIARVKRKMLSHPEIQELFHDIAG